jgi:hypothetical protein
MSHRRKPPKPSAAFICCGVLGAVAVLWVAFESVSSALSTGQVPVGTLRSGPRHVVYVPWHLVAPLAVGLLFVMGACVALAAPRLRMLTVGAPPLVALFLCGPLFMLMQVFCLSPVGNALFAVAAAGAFVLLKGIGRLDKRAEAEENLTC